MTKTIIHTRKKVPLPPSFETAFERSRGDFYILHSTDCSLLHIPTSSIFASMEIANLLLNSQTPIIHKNCQTHYLELLIQNPYIQNVYDIFNTKHHQEITFSIQEITRTIIETPNIYDESKFVLKILEACADQQITIQNTVITYNTFELYTLSCDLLKVKNLVENNLRNHENEYGA